MHSFLKKSAAILFAVLTLCLWSAGQDNLVRKQPTKHSCLSSWIEEDEGSSLPLEFVIIKYNLNRENLIKFVRERGGLSPKQKRAIGEFATKLREPNVRTPNKTAVETLIRLIIDGVEVSEIAISLTKYHPKNPDQYYLRTGALQTRDTDKWIYTGPTNPEIAPGQAPDFDEFIQICSKPLKLAPGLSPVIIPYSIYREPQWEKNRILNKHGTTHKGIFITYIEGYPTPVIIKFLHSRLSKKEAFDYWMTHLIGLGPEFLGILEPQPGFRDFLERDYIGLVFAPTSGVFEYLNSEQNENNGHFEIFERLSQFGKTPKLQVQIMVSDKGTAIIDPADAKLFPDEYAQLQRHEQQQRQTLNTAA